MPKRTIVIVLVAVVVLAIVSGMIASSLTSSTGGDGAHAMPDGSTMQGDQMP